MRLFLRYLRIAFSATCLIACVLLIVLWVRSYWIDHIAMGQFANAHAFRIDSVLGRVAVLSRAKYPGTSHDPFHLRTDEHPEVYWEPDDNFLGFHYQADEGGILATTPYLPVVLGAGAICYVPWIPWRFTLRTLLIATTLVAVVLGLIVDQ
jgi:hypothetical protein